MNYIGSKHKLSGFILQTVKQAVGTDLSQQVFCDLFAGTGIVSRVFKPEVKQIITNDLEYYSYVLNKNYIENNHPFDYANLFESLNQLNPVKGFIYQNYCLGSGSNRQYFSDENGMKIDAIRQELAKLKPKIEEGFYYFLLASLLESADKVANTAAVYGAFLKHLKSSAKKKLDLKPALFKSCNQHNEVYNQDGNQLIKNIKGTILYLDPPYNSRQYGANYHLLNTLSHYQNFVPKGLTGLPDYKKSDYCKKDLVLKSFEDLIEQAQFKFIFLSYNNEGLMSEEAIKKTMKNYGHYQLEKQSYQRFKADKTESRKHKASQTTEYLHLLEKR
ncbi:MAG: modification methylase [Flavobacteriales bacterium CG11_big_fil_rev_8_21_14_0_20_35_7]|nr:MAG: modification methylase [Flavobacteriales bacterium CG11_big_fil_rev_8_21_14_0_20_35_7]